VQCRPWVRSPSAAAVTCFPSPWRQSDTPVVSSHVIYPLQQRSSSSSDADSSSNGQDERNIMEPRGSLPRSQEPATGHWPGCHGFSSVPHTLSRYLSRLQSCYYYRCICVWVCLVLGQGSRLKFCRHFLFMCATCSAHPALHYLSYT
jgi:hypothetical protein